MGSKYSTPLSITADVLCFSHLRWDFVYQRPQHLMSRFGRRRRVFFIEEPVAYDGQEPSWLFSEVEENVIRCVPKLPHRTTKDRETGSMQFLMGSLAHRYDCHRCVEWFYTPMMVDWAIGLDAVATVYDCMDELSKFRFAPSGLADLESELLKRADLVFTGGHSLYTAKKHQHSSIHEFPSSVDASHFRKALFEHDEMPDQAGLDRPRIGYAGVIDERIDLELLAMAADLRPQWSFVMVGPIVKLDPHVLPQRPNIHYLGMKEYRELPGYFAGWDVGMMPFALNESTEFISPTKTPEYLAAGLPVVSTPIADVVRPYGSLGLVEIASTALEFVESVERAMKGDKIERLRQVDVYLAERSWDRTYQSMNILIGSVLRKPREIQKAASKLARAGLNYAT